MIQIRDVPEGLHRKLKSRAALQGLSLSGYLLREIEQAAGRPSLQEMAERLAARPSAKYGVSPAAILRLERTRR